MLGRSGDSQCRCVDRQVKAWSETAQQTMGNGRVFTRSSNHSDRVKARVVGRSAFHQPMPLRGQAGVRAIQNTANQASQSGRVAGST
jgi:hypothetical protein